MVINLLSNTAFIDATKMNDDVIEGFITSFNHAIRAKDPISLRVEGGSPLMDLEVTFFEFSEAKIDTDQKKVFLKSDTAYFTFHLPYKEVKRGNVSGDMDKYYFYSEHLTVSIKTTYTLQNRRFLTNI